MNGINSMDMLKPIWESIPKCLIRDCKQCNSKPRLYFTKWESPFYQLPSSYSMEYELTCKLHNITQYNSRFHNEFKTRRDGKVPSDDMLFLISTWNKYNEN